MCALDSLQIFINFAYPFVQNGISRNKTFTGNDDLLLSFQLRQYPFMEKMPPFGRSLWANVGKYTIHRFDSGDVSKTLISWSNF